MNELGQWFLTAVRWFHVFLAIRERAIEAAETLRCMRSSRGQVCAF